MKDFKWFLVTLAILMVGLLVWMCVETAYAERYTIAVVDAGGGLNVRTGPGVEHRVSFMLADDAEVAIIETLDNWAFVHSRTLIGKREPLG